MLFPAPNGYGLDKLLGWLQLPHPPAGCRVGVAVDGVSVMRLIWDIACDRQSAYGWIEDEKSSQHIGSI